MLKVNCLPGQDTSEPAAIDMRDRFIPWLAQHHPELGITGTTEWTGTIISPHILIVRYYMFFSEEWEMGIRWHVMIPPHDWAEIYLRHRHNNLSSVHAFKIDSVGAGDDPNACPLPVEGIWR